MIFLGVAMAAIGMFFTNGSQLRVSASNATNIAFELNELGEPYYQLGCKFENIDPNYNPSIEFPSIRNALTVDKRCVVNINPNLRVSIATGDTAVIDQLNQVESDYVFSDTGVDIAEVLERYMHDRCNVVIYSERKQHFVAVFKHVDDFLVIDGLGGFTFTTLNLIGLQKWCEDYVGSTKYSLTTARLMDTDETVMLNEIASHVIETEGGNSITIESDNLSESSDDVSLIKNFNLINVQQKKNSS